MSKNLVKTGCFHWACTKAFGITCRNLDKGDGCDSFLKSCGIQCVSSSFECSSLQKSFWNVKNLIYFSSNYNYLAWTHLPYVFLSKSMFEPLFEPGVGESPTSQEEKTVF